MTDAATAKEDRLAAVFLARERWKVRLWKGRQRQAFIVLRSIRNQGAYELRKRPAGALGGDLSIAKSLFVQTGIIGILTKHFDQRLQILAHLHFVLDRAENLLLQRRRALIPEHAATPVIAQVHQRHRISRCRAALMPRTESFGIGKCVALLMARRAGDGVAGRQTGVIKKHSAERRTRISDRIICRRVVESSNGGGSINCRKRVVG